MSDETIICDRCGAANQPGDKFCAQCGALLAATEEPPAAPLPVEPVNPEPAAAEPTVPAEPPATSAAGETGAPAEWPFVVAPRQEETHETGTPPPPTWTADASSQTPLAESMASSARYIVIAGIALLVLSCLWVFLSIGTHLQARFGIFCLAPLGLIFLVVGLFLLLSRNSNRRA